jgi:acetyl esterase/lipase
MASRRRPALDPHAQRLLRSLRAGQHQGARPTGVESRRRALEDLMALGRREIAVGSVREGSVPGPHGPLPVRVYSPPRDAALLPGLAYFHGGGLLAGSLATHDAIARALSCAGGCRVVSVDYRLAPEHRFPAALEDAAAATAYIGAHAADFGIEAARFGVCGDSAGAALAAAVAHGARSTRVKLALQLLLCPILDYSGSTPSKKEFSNGYLIDQAMLDEDLLHYLPPGVAATDPLVSPLLAAGVDGLPRTLIHTAEFDPLRDEGHDYFERLTECGVEVSYTCHAGMIHLFYGLGALIPYADSAFEQVGAQLRAALA